MLDTKTRDYLVFLTKVSNKEKIQHYKKEHKIPKRINIFGTKFTT